jgi:predicted transcriptional regulator of viral defense system
MFLHGLTDQYPKTIYFNIEQKNAGGGGELTQESIKRAFAAKSRVTSNVAKLGANRVFLVSGKNTSSLGVVQLDTSLGSGLRVTDLERTLIDAAVRPVYSGGVFEVAHAFDEAAGKYSVNRLCAYLNKLNYTYPYHQAMGFYMEQTRKYKPSQLELLEQFPTEFDFYLTHGMREKDYVKRWRLFVPKGL